MLCIRGTAANGFLSSGVPPAVRHQQCGSVAATYEAGDKQTVHRLLTAVASHHPKRVREFLWDAYRVVGRLYCGHSDDAPGRLLQIKSLSEHREAPKVFA